MQSERGGKDQEEELPPQSGRTEGWSKVAKAMMIKWDDDLRHLGELGYLEVIVDHREGSFYDIEVGVGGAEIRLWWFDKWIGGEEV